MKFTKLLTSVYLWPVRIRFRSHRPVTDDNKIIDFFRKRNNNNNSSS